MDKAASGCYGLNGVAAGDDRHRRPTTHHQDASAEEDRDRPPPTAPPPAHRPAAGGRRLLSGLTARHLTPSAGCGAQRPPLRPVLACAAPRSGGSPPSPAGAVTP